jgi:hypothetical protein
MVSFSLAIWQLLTSLYQHPEHIAARLHSKKETRPINKAFPAVQLSFLFFSFLFAIFGRK